MELKILDVFKEDILKVTHIYHCKIIEDYRKKNNAELTGMILHTGKNYYSIDIGLLENDTYKYKDIDYDSYTPLLLINRKFGINPFTYDSEINFNLSNEEIKEQRIKAHSEFPWVLHTLGCDDTSKGWLFKTKQDAKSFIQFLIKDLKLRKKSDMAFKTYDDFLNAYKTNQHFLN